MNKYGRVRCLTLRDTPSFGILFKPEELFKYDPSITMEDIEAYVDQEFDTINGELFVKAYIPPMPPEQKRSGNKNKAQKKIKRFDRIYDIVLVIDDIHSTARELSYAVYRLLEELHLVFVILKIFVTVYNGVDFGSQELAVLEYCFLILLLGIRTQFFISQKKKHSKNYYCADDQY